MVTHRIDNLADGAHGGGHAALCGAAEDDHFLRTARRGHADAAPRLPLDAFPGGVGLAADHLVEWVRDGQVGAVDAVANHLDAAAGFVGMPRYGGGPCLWRGGTEELAERDAAQGDEREALLFHF